MKIEVINLTGAALNWAVAKSLKLPIRNPSDYVGNTKDWMVRLDGEKYSPSTNWSQGGEIVEEATTITQRKGVYEVEIPDDSGFHLSYKGSTLLEAAMRAKVSTVFGYQIDVPEVLL